MSEARHRTGLVALLDRGLIQPEDLAALGPVADRYAVAVTPYAARLIEKNDGPMRRQFIPDAQELVTQPAERPDPIGDDAHSPVPGLVHRHADRVLFKLVNLCPVYCRFCFRRETVGPGKDAVLPAAEIDQALSYIREHAEIWEIIFTGGDPLMLSPRRIREVVSALDEVRHVKVLRWHTRVPAVDPDRVTDALAEAIAGTDKAVYLALHANHPDELTDACRAACLRLAEQGIRLVSQSVLLRGVNNDPGVLSDLMRGFVEAGITPYYLHHGDLAPGTSHFRVPINEGLRIVRGLRSAVSGLCQPTYVLDLPGGYGKVPLTSHAVREISPGVYEIEDGLGRVHLYRDVLSVADGGDVDCGQKETGA